MIRREFPVTVLRQLLRLDPETGRLFWRERGIEWFRDTSRRTAAHACAAWNARYAEQAALATPDGRGYRHGTMFGETYQAHVVVFALDNGRWPVGEVDHWDTDKANDRPINLREATKAQNQRNRGTRGGSSLYCGVFWHKAARKWQASCKDGLGKSRNLGLFTDEIAAAHAYDAAACEHHGEFAHLNFPVSV